MVLVDLGWRVCGSFGRRLVDAADGLCDEQCGADEFGKSDRLEVVAARLSGGDAEQQVGDEGGEDLQLHRIFRSPEEAFDLEMLFDPSEQKLNPLRIRIVDEVELGAVDAAVPQTRFVQGVQGNGWRNRRA